MEIRRIIYRYYHPFFATRHHHLKVRPSLVYKFTDPQTLWQDRTNKKPLVLIHADGVIPKGKDDLALMRVCKCIRLEMNQMIRTPQYLITFREAFIYLPSPPPMFCLGNLRKLYGPRTFYVAFLPDAKAKRRYTGSSGDKNQDEIDIDKYLAIGCLLPDFDRAYELQPRLEKRLGIVLNAFLRAVEELSILTAESTMEVTFEGPLSDAFVEDALAEMARRFNPRMWLTILRRTKEQLLRGTAWP